MIVKLLTEHHLEFLSLKGGCRGSSESTLVKLLEISCRSSNSFLLTFDVNIMIRRVGLFQTHFDYESLTLHADYTITLDAVFFVLPFDIKGRPLYLVSSAS